MKKNLPEHSFTDHSTNAITLARVIDVHGYSSKAIFKQYGINLDSLHNDSRFRGINLQPVWAQMSDTIGDHLGILYAENFQPGSYHGLSFAMAASSSLLDAFNCLARYFRVIANVGCVEVCSSEETVNVYMRLPVPTGIAENTSVDAAIALFLRLARFAKHSPLNPSRVSMQRPTPDNDQYFKDFFSCPIDYNSKEDCLTFSSEVLKSPLPAANILLAKANIQIMDHYLKSFDFDHFSSMVSVHILNLFPTGKVTQIKVARIMNMSVRTLQRKLEQEGIMFNELVETTRLTLAKQYLEQEWQSIGETAYLLGYSEPSNFSRSFKRLTGLTPIEYRESAKRKS